MAKSQTGRKFTDATGALEEFLFASPELKQENEDTSYHLNWIQQGILKIRRYKIPIVAGERMRAQYEHTKRAIPQNITDLLQEGRETEAQESNKNQATSVQQIYSK